MTTPTTPANSEALESALNAMEGRLSDADAALVALLRTLAAELDSGESTGRTVAAYLSGLRMLQRRADLAASSPGDAERSAGASLSRLRAKHNGRLS